jgi:hypothetical protein
VNLGLGSYGKESAGNRAGYAVLQRERVLQISFKALRPVPFIRHLDQLGRAHDHRQADMGDVLRNREHFAYEFGIERT